jgi:hypothetical protein
MLHNPMAPSILVISPRNVLPSPPSYALGIHTPRTMHCAYSASHPLTPIIPHLHRHIQRAPNPDSLIQRVQIDHRRRHVAMAQQLLHRPNVIAVSQAAVLRTSAAACAA